MYEPIDPVVACPKGGWNKAAIRVELRGVEQLPEAVYHLACLARQNRMGFVATFLGRDLYAYPHQTTSEITRGYQQMRAMESSQQIGSLKPRIERWTPHAKAAVVTALRLKVMARLDALQAYGISEEELQSWETRFADAGLSGLKVVA